MPGVLAEAAARAPDQPAVVDGDERVTYRELVARVQGGAEALVKAGVEPGDRVAIWAPNSLAWIVGMLSLSSAGGVLVPLNTRFKGPEAADILRRSRARVLLTVRSFLGRDYTAMLAGADLPDLCLTVTIDDGGWERLALAGAATRPALADPAGEVAERLRSLGADSPLDLMFTSGTTGRPKGVASSHGATVRAYRHYAATLGIRPGDRYLLVNPLFHSFGSKAGLVAALTARATLYPVATFDPGGAAELIAREAITVLPGPPTIYQSLLDLPADVRTRLGSLRLAVTGAAAVPVELLARMRAELGFETVLTAYGLTEAGGLVTMCDPGDPPEVVSRTSGRPVPGVEVRITGTGGAPAATGESGEVEVRGYPVMDGYVDDPVATADAITPDGWLRTGDIGVLDEEGGLRITDRKKDLFIVGGFNAYPAEIENALLGHPDVSRVAVVGVPDARLGEVGEAFVVPQPGTAIDADDLVAWARERMANFKVPRRVHVVDELPLNASGKVLKHVLKDRLSETRQTRETRDAGDGVSA